MYTRLVASASIFGIGIFLINAAASAFYWYVTMPWFDMMMHILGGVFVALLGASFFFSRIRMLPTYELFVTVLLFVFIIGLAWEYYEYIVQFYVKGVQLAHLTDSISDIICDVVGGSIGTCFVILLKKRYNTR